MWSRASVCVTVRGRTPTLLHGLGCNLEHGRGCPLLVHYWADLQPGHGLHCYGNITRTLVTSLFACIPRYDDIVRTAGWAGSAGDRRATGGAPKTARRIREAGAAGPPATGRRRGAFSTLLRKYGLRASTGGVLATKSERKMLASLCLAWLYYYPTFHGTEWQMHSFVYLFKNQT